MPWFTGASWSHTFGFQCTLFASGTRRAMASGLGHTSTQHPQYQHSPGYSTIGGLPFSGLGDRMSTWQTSMHRLQPLQISGLNSRGSKSASSGEAVTFFALMTDPPSGSRGFEPNNCPREIRNNRGPCCRHALPRFRVPRSRIYATREDRSLESPDT